MNLLTFIVVVILAVAAIEFFLRRNVRPGAARVSSGNRRDQYDLFISYKSDDVHLVRPVAERLLASGVRVWFAEYEILLIQRNAWARAVAGGIRKSRYAVCFTNDTFARSPDCREELEHVLACKAGENIIEIQCPPEALTHREYPKLADSPHTSFQCADETLRFLGRVTGLRIEPGDGGERAARPTSFPFGQTGYSLDLDGWEIERGIPQITPETADPDTYGPRFRRWSASTLLWGHLLLGPQDMQRAAFAPNEDSDRAYYEAAVEFAWLFYGKKWKQQCLGVHLITLGGAKHPAFTTRVLPGTLSRLYSLVLPHPETGKDVEAAFFFFCQGSLRDFQRCAYLLDRLVLSFRWDAANCGRQSPV
jgi:hypothetical protein